jgi:hypothetical protein
MKGQSAHRRTELVSLNSIYIIYAEYNGLPLPKLTMLALISTALNQRMVISSK